MTDRRLWRVAVSVWIAVLIVLAQGAIRGPLAEAKGCKGLGVARTVRCAANYVGGVNPDKAVRVAGGPTQDCPNGESGLNPYARNYPYLGLFQHNVYYWPRRVNRFWWGDGHSIWNYRVQSFVTVRMVKHVGWGPWSCA